MVVLWHLPLGEHQRIRTDFRSLEEVSSAIIGKRLRPRCLHPSFLPQFRIGPQIICSITFHFYFQRKMNHKFSSNFSAFTNAMIWFRLRPNWLFSILNCLSRRRSMHWCITVMNIESARQYQKTKAAHSNPIHILQEFARRLCGTRNIKNSLECLPSRISSRSCNPITRQRIARSMNWRSIN